MSTDPKELISIYKKNGNFDKTRKTLVDNFKKSQTSSNLQLKLKVMIEQKIKNDPNILLKNKGKMAALIQGEILNSKDNSILNIVDKDIQDKIIDSDDFHKMIRDDIYDIKRKILGISDEEFEKIKAEEREKLEKEKARRQTSYKNNFKVKSLVNNGTSHLVHRVNKPPKFNIKDKKEEPKKEEKKKIPFMMY
ncbi:unnamed protein product [Candida verbasci]|uniref:BOD1/SHG1 domain-containing protein n=1 Tax=Candida verbasci TaxID=1227364 RepID=A0A9W4TVU6_9ASCO|nr:unnamed protein product [Candida verbasci]